MTGSPRWPARSTSTWSRTTRWPGRPVAAAPLVAALRRAGSCSAGVARSCCPIVLTLVLHPLAATGPAAAGRCCCSWPRPSWSPWSAACFPALLAVARRLPAAQLVLHPARRAAHRRRAENLVALLVYVAVAVGVATVVDRASRRADRGDPRPRGGRHAGRRSRARCSPARTPRRRSWTGCARRSGRTPSSLLAQDPAGWAVVARPSGDAAPRTPDEGDTRVAVDDDHVLALCGRAAPGHRPAGAGGASPCRPALVLEYRRLREREDRAAALERPRRPDRAAAGGLARPAHPAGDDARRGRRAGLRTRDAGRRGPAAAGRRPSDGSTDQLERLIDNLLDLSRLQSGLRAAGSCGRTSLEEMLPLAVAGQPPGAVVARDRRVAAAGAAPTRACWSGWSPTSSATRCGVSAGQPVRVLAHVLPDDRRDPGRRPRTRRTRRTSGSGCSSRSSGSTTPAPGGLGLGLAVARGLAEAIGGTLSAEDTPGGGLTMVLSVPRADRGGRRVTAHRSWSSTTSRRWPAPSRSTCAPTAGRSSPRPTAGPRWRPPPTDAPRRGAARPRAARPRRHRGDRRAARLDHGADRGALRAPARRGQGRGARPRRRRLRHQAVRDERADGPAAGRRTPGRRSRRPRPPSSRSATS